jgi:hypothetical protein
VLIVPDGATATIALPVPQASGSGGKRAWKITPRVVTQQESGNGLLTLLSERGKDSIAEWSWIGAGSAPACIDLPSRTVELGDDEARAWLVLRAGGGSAMLDRTTLGPPP